MTISRGYKKGTLIWNGLSLVPPLRPHFSSWTTSPDLASSVTSSHLLSWATKFDHLRFITQSLSPEYSHQLPKSVLSSSLVSEAVVRRCSVEKVFFKISQNLQKNTCTRVSFLMKLQTLVLQLYFKRDCVTGVFLWILRISKNIWFTEHFRWLLLP